VTPTDLTHIRELLNKRERLGAKVGYADRELYEAALALLAEVDRLAFRDAAHGWLGAELMAPNVGEQVTLVKP